MTNAPWCAQEKKITRLRAGCTRSFPKPGRVPPRPGDRLYGSGDSQRLRCAVRVGGRSLSGLLRRGTEQPKDQGTKMLSALASVIDAEDPEEIERILDGIVDPDRDLLPLLDGQGDAGPCHRVAPDKRGLPARRHES